MMKKLFNSQWFIITLSLFAVAMLIRSITMPFLDKPQYSDDVPYDPWDETILKNENTIENIELNQVLSDRILWETQPDRDPFSRTIKIDNDDVRTVQNQVHAEMDDIFDGRPVLSALIAGEQSKFAIINGILVEEGDYVESLKVRKIAKNGVWLYGAGKVVKLDIPGVIIQ